MGNLNVWHLLCFAHIPIMFVWFDVFMESIELPSLQNDLISLHSSLERVFAQNMKFHNAKTISIDFFCGTLQMCTKFHPKTCEWNSQRQQFSLVYGNKNVKFTVEWIETLTTSHALTRATIRKCSIAAIMLV